MYILEYTYLYTSVYTPSIPNALFCHDFIPSYRKMKSVDLTLNPDLD